ncbi:hypothetical protein DIE23_32660 [Burkholderia sp. Bp9143]|uniref:hypothetical protein n=1 Tax=Burkholderia sp. Bp9143 TaxID=2184574 RepID=UPI000F5B21FC|nr:hypothetical protein [Burkholderia sp. Bp9143]RQR25125.1 hypothetical protein DIE23_32660 [Burkholderia sp. Bp9143]
MSRPSFVRAVNSTRPYGAHRYDLFGPKIGRRLTLFGRHALDLWLRLESDPHVLVYCEQPLCIPDANPSRPVDFWVRTPDGEKLCVVLRSAESTAAALGGSLFPAFEMWSRASSLQLDLIHPHHLDDSPALRENRMTMLHHLAATHSIPVGQLMQCVLTGCRYGLTLNELERRLEFVDPMLVRSAVFRLVLCGEVRCPTLALELLGPHTYLELP